MPLHDADTVPLHDADEGGFVTQPQDLPPPEPAKLLAFWMEWERGDSTPGQTMSNFKKGGMRDLLESTVAAHTEAFGSE